MQCVYHLFFEREYDHREDTELSIGFYATKEDAQSAILTLQDKPGFNEFRDGFGIDKLKVGMTGWRGGFVSEVGPPPKDAAGEVFDLPAEV